MNQSATEGQLLLHAAGEVSGQTFSERPELRYVEQLLLALSDQIGRDIKDLAEELDVDLRLYNIIYELIEDMEKALIGMLEPVQQENVVGRGEVIQIFKISRLGTVAGTVVREGKVLKVAHVRLVRDGVVVHEGKMASLRRYQDDVKEVLEGQDCGIHIENFNDVKVGDLMEFYELEEIPPEL